LINHVQNVVNSVEYITKSNHGWVY
jgi:hypothetical protein